MDMLPRRSLLILSFLACWLSGPGVRAQAPAKKEARLADYFGFQPLELYKLEHRIGNLKRISAGEGVERASALAVGDLDQDGRDDIALLAENELVFIHQTAPGTLGEPERVPHTAAKPWLIKAVDIDGDRAKDLVILD